MGDMVLDNLRNRLSLTLVLLVAFAIGSSSLVASHLTMPPVTNVQSQMSEHPAQEYLDSGCSAETRDCGSDLHDHCNTGCFNHGLSKSVNDSSWYQPREFPIIPLATNTHPPFSAPSFRPPIA